MRIGFAITLLLASLAIFTTVIVKHINYSRNCDGHLKRAADANSIELAQQELGTALNYIESHNLTSGYTSVLYTTPDEDLGFWYQNIKASYESLVNIDSTATELEKSNVLMKLRETLLDAEDGGKTVVTSPTGISRFPNNTLWCLLKIFASLAMCMSIVLFIYPLFD